LTQLGEIVTTTGAFVQIRDLTVTYPTPMGELRAVDGVNLDVYRGEVLGLVGESGCGKTTLGLAMLRMNSPGRVVKGKVNVDGVDVLSLEGERLRRYRWEKVAMIFQSAMNALDPVKTVESQIVETIVQHGRTNKEKAKARVRELLETVKIDPLRAKSFPHELSGGMKQRIIIALALCLSPELLIADEPTTALDVVVQASILKTIKELQERLKLTIILITHDISIVGEMSDRLAIMYAGKVVEVGRTIDVVYDPQHPYTQALIKAIPTIGYKNAEIKGIPGVPPNLLSPPSGCRFHPRCPFAFDRCKTEEPPLINNGKDHVACWLRSA
jgi:peptide/nickel transport system ATP-binding protein